MFQIENLDDLVGQVLPVKFLEIEQERDRLVFSARKASNDRDMKTFSVSLASWAVLPAAVAVHAFCHCLAVHWVTHIVLLKGRLLRPVTLYLATGFQQHKDVLVTARSE